VILYVNYAMISLEMSLSLKCYVWPLQTPNTIYINVKEARRSNHEWTTQRHWQHWVHKTLGDHCLSFCIIFVGLCNFWPYYTLISSKFSSPPFLVGSVLLISLVFCVVFFFYCLRPVSCVPNVASVSGLSITLLNLLGHYRAFLQNQQIHIQIYELV
jgi:hypothetical protein